MSEIKRHKVFISYFHRDDQFYKDYLINMSDYYKGQLVSIFEDYSVRDNEIDDTLPAERIRCIIRDEYIKDATVLILLCGQNTKCRKHIDWEIHAAMFNTENNPQMGILVINLPTVDQYIRASTNEEKALISDNTSWVSLSSRSEYERAYPYMPSRIIDNFIKGVPITVVDWTTIAHSPERLKKLIDLAFLRRYSNQYDHSTPLKKHNS